ncbi:MAG TPA: transposase [Kofleriaceae bacterium]|nr:transposase [Kofleriaceae bacterium]
MRGTARLRAWSVTSPSPSLHAGVVIADHDREALERLARYGARPAFAHDRLTWTSDGRVSYKLKRPRRVFAQDVLPYTCGGRRTVVAFVADANLTRTCLPASASPPSPQRLHPPGPHPGRARLVRPRVASPCPPRPPTGHPSAWIRPP